MSRIRGFFRPHLVFSAGTRARDPTPIAHDRARRFREVMLPHLDATYNLARYLARDADAAEDIVQDAFLRAFRGFEGYRGEAARPWLFAILRNCFLDWARANRDSAQRLSLAETEMPGEAHHDHPEAILMRQDEAAMLRATIEELPEPFRETLVLRELEELSYKEIAMLTQVPIGTVMSRLARARSMLAALILPTALRDREAGA